MNETTVIDSGKPGPTLLVLGGVHGNETCGVDLVCRMVENPDAYRPTAGKIVCAYGNPAAIAAGVRCVTHDLNRLFLPEERESACGCAEHVRAAELRPLLASADVLLDIHASFTPRSEPFVICETSAVPFLRQMPVRKVCFGFDDIQPGGTDYYMNFIGKTGICVECGYLADESGVDIAEASLRALMASMGMSDSADVETYLHQYLRAYQQYYARDLFMMPVPQDDFASIDRNALIGYDGPAEIRAAEDSTILFAKSGIKKGGEAFVLLRAVDPTLL